jgi:hypothetical protein
MKFIFKTEHICRSLLVKSFCGWPFLPVITGRTPKCPFIPAGCFWRSRTARPVVATKKPQMHNSLICRSAAFYFSKWLLHSRQLYFLSKFHHILTENGVCIHKVFNRLAGMDHRGMVATTEMFADRF